MKFYNYAKKNAHIKILMIRKTCEYIWINGKQVVYWSNDLSMGSIISKKWRITKRKTNSSKSIFETGQKWINGVAIEYFPKALELYIFNTKITTIECDLYFHYYCNFLLLCQRHCSSYVIQIFKIKILLSDYRKNYYAHI